MLVLAIAGFVGFEATVVLSEEAKDPKRTIARATHWAVILAGLLCGLSAWAMSVTAGPDQIVAAAQEHQTDLVFALVAPHVPAVLVRHRLRAVHDQRVRRAAGLPRRGGALPVRARPRGRAARGVGADPPAHRRAAARLDHPEPARARRAERVRLRPTRSRSVYVFAWLTTIGGLGVLILMWAASAAVIAFFVRQPPAGRTCGGHRSLRCSPSCCSPWCSRRPSSASANCCRSPGDSPFQWLIPAAYAVVAAIGFVWALDHAGRAAGGVRRDRPRRGRACRHRRGVIRLPRRIHAEPVGARSYHY